MPPKRGIFFAARCTIASQPANARAELPLARAVERLELEARVVEERRDVRHRAVREVVDADDLVSVRQQALADVRADEAGGAGDADALPHAALPSLALRQPLEDRPAATRSATPVTACPLTISG